MHSDCPPALGALAHRGRIRAALADFQVTEILGFEPGGGGEHLWLYLEKTDWNTADVASYLARTCKVPLRVVGYSGLKDRRAITRQWFSVQLPGKPDPDWPDWPDGLTLLTQVRHGRKLNRGTHRRNRFEIRVTGMTGDRAALEGRLAQVVAGGVPNYFGVQRFGRESRNVERAVAWLCDGGEAPRKAASRSLWLSALRSELFNRVLAERVRRDCWNRCLPGDVLQPDGSRGLFLADDDAQSTERVAAGEVHPTAPMPGRDGMQPGGEALALEQAALAGCEGWIAALADFGVDGLRRATRLPVLDLAWTWPADDVLALTFELPAGAFATSVLAELIEVEHVAAGQ